MSRIGVFGQISEINDHLFLSGAGVLKPDKIKQKKISFIVNATTEEPNAMISGVDNLKIRIEDHPYANLAEHFDTVADRIKAVKERGGKTLVHCMAGVSRSASLVMIYLVKHERMSLRQAYLYVRSARPVVHPNVGFWKQMVDYEKRLRGASTVKMVQTIHCDMPLPDIYVEDIRRNSQFNRFVSPSITTASTKPSSSVSSSSSTAVATPFTYAKRRGFSPSLGLSSTLRRGTSPSAASTIGLRSYSLLSPAPSRKPRESLFSIYASPRNTFFSAF